ncbi:hypothetical protein MBLNU459_g8538t2 [Dothideomycetes sp. NU459]
MASNIKGNSQVDGLVARLESDLVDARLSQKDRQSLLEQLKVLGRTPANAASISNGPGVKVLCNYAFDVKQQTAVSQEALRCLANTMLLQESARQKLVDLEYVDKAANDDRDDEFLISRIIFLLTYNTTADIATLVREQSLAESMCRNISVHAKRYDGSSKKGAHAMDEMAFAETLKLLFNITAHEPDLVSYFSSCVGDLFNILAHIKLPSPTLQQPVGLITNALMNLQMSEDCCTEAVTGRLIEILDETTKTYAEQDIDTAAMPLVTLLRQVYVAASLGVEQLMKKQLLPSDDQRDKPLGQDDTLPSRLLRLTGSSSMFTLKDNLSTLFFELSDSDPTKLIRNIGYGYAAGFLATHKVQVPREAMQEGGGAADGDDAINPVTGQRRAAEPVDTGPEMTDEEKEREAERLFVLFERLKATGVMDVKNPVQQAMEDGRFEEIE